MASFFKPSKHKKGFSIKPKGAASNRLRDAMNTLDRQMSIGTGSPAPEGHGAGTSSNLVAPSRRSCPNPQCPNPFAPIDEGYCTGCGRQIESANIVAEVQFNETASGAAVVQGSFIAADQGASRSLGPGMRRIGGVIGDSRERTIREARQMMAQYAQQLKLSDNVVNEGVQVFKLALSQNWIQGRGMIKVVPVCLYAACRRQDRCRVMLIDFADLVKVNVYELGHVFKALNDIYDFGHNKIKSIIPEDLMYRFCDKLDFGDMTKDVAELAARFCQRMGLDWMVMGRRPSGICGACIFLAAQVWGFRRTVREIVYVVKVTMHTIEQRLDEFKVVESSDLTIEDFLKQELLESRHDPPSFYRKQAEWVDKMEKQREQSGRKRKRAIEDIGEEEEEEEGGEEGSASTTPRATPAPSRASASREMPPPPIPHPDMSKLPQVSAFLKKSDAIDHLAESYAEANKAPKGQPGTKQRRKHRREPVEPLITFNEEWEQEEEVLEKQIDEVISDPSSDEHRKALATAAYHARVKATWARSQLPAKDTKMDEVIDPEEFADDPEVENCLLTEEEIEMKELIWLNANKDWLRKQQSKQFEKEMELLGPKKKRRNRLKKPRIGEGQLTPASTPGEAAVATMKKFTMSSRINLDAIKNLFPTNGRRGGPGSVAQSSRADSEVPESEAGDDDKKAAKGKQQQQQQQQQKSTEAEEPEEEEYEEEEEEEAYEDYDETQGFDDYDEGDGEEEYY
ncbi:hypothetical protein BX600DRAFT_388091 [Xylariales sp. PMI_506]|nr:hypothetical protein BX600DRAFT_388091 [Xylariales sp. PMI_506]